MTVNLSFIGGAGWQFFDDNGDPLSGGKIYTYAAGTTTPLTTYTSRDGLTPNTNPVILDAAGRTPQQIWATEGSLYKYVVRTSSDVLIRTWDNIGGSIVASDLATTLAAPTGATLIGLTGFKGQVGTVADIADSDGSDWLGFTFTGGTARSIQDKLQGSVSPEDFGAVGDGIVDDSPAVIAALQYCSDTGVPFVARGGATYRMASQSTVNRTNGKAMTVDWAGATVVCDEASGVIFGSSPTAFLSTSLNTNIARGDASIRLNSVAGLAKGDLLEILSPARTQGTLGSFHYYVVNQVDGNDVYIEGTTVADVNPQQIIDSGQTGSITVAAYRLSPAISVQNATFQMVNTTGASYYAIFPQGHSKVYINNITFTGNGRFQLGSQYNGFMDVGNCTFRDFGYTDANSGYSNLPSAPNGLSFGYGFIITRTYQVLFHNNFGLRGWHTIDASRGTMEVHISDCFFDRNAYGVSSHEGAWYVTVKDCVFDGGLGLTCARNSYTFVENCTFKNLAENGIAYSPQCIELRVKDSLFQYNPGVASTTGALFQTTGTGAQAGALSVGFPRVFEFINNAVEGICRCAIGFSGSPLTSGNLAVKGNRFIQLDAVNISLMKNSVIEGNVASNVEGQFPFTMSVSATDPYVFVSNNTYTNGAPSTGNNAMFAISGSGAPVFKFTNNMSADTGYLIRFNSVLTVDSVLHCGNMDGRLFLGASTVTNAINNYYKIGIASTTTVTNSVNNQVLT
jgi:hypothetical protein